MPLTSEQILQDRYRIIALLGQGGMGAVYRAWDLRLQKPVALKEMVPQPGLEPELSVQLRMQFRQEALVLGRLTHPHLVPVTDVFDEQGNNYLVMAFVEGENLAERIRREGPLPEARVVAWARQLLDALGYCHKRGVIHRDIKPQNVVITPDDDAVLVDFGLVKLWDPADPQTRTVMRGMGTPEYAPPEQWGAPPEQRGAPPAQGGEASRHTDPRADLYSLGATLYHALTGQAPPTASSRMAYPKQFRTPRELTGSISAQVDATITRAMALSVDDRWPDAAAMAGALAVTVATAPLEGAEAGPPLASAQTQQTPAQTQQMPEEAGSAPWPVSTRAPAPADLLKAVEPRTALPTQRMPEDAEATPRPVSTRAPAPADPLKAVGPRTALPTQRMPEEAGATPGPVPTGVPPQPEPKDAAEPRRGAHRGRWVVGGIALVVCLAGLAAITARLTGLWPAAPTATPRVVAATQRVVAQPTRTVAAAAPTEPPPTQAAAAASFTVGMVTDQGGIDDRSFNAMAWRGVERAIEELGVQGSYLESYQQADYAPNLTQYLDQDADLIIAVGYLLADDTAALATQNPEATFAIVDHSYDPPLDNVRALSFATDEAAFLAGYVAAAATKTGRVGCFGGVNIPAVARFLVGYEAGVKAYNQQHGASVEVVGWDTAAAGGLFSGNFESTDDGRRMGEDLLAKGADVLLPVAGPVGLGTAEVVKAAGNAWIIGVDNDWTVSAPEYREIILTSVLKRVDNAIFEAIKLAISADGKVLGGDIVGTLANDGVGLAGIAKGAISGDVEKELLDLRQGLAEGRFDTGWAAYLEAQAAEGAP